MKYYTSADLSGRGYTFQEKEAQYVVQNSNGAICPVIAGNGEIHYCGVVMEKSLGNFTRMIVEIFQLEGYLNFPFKAEIVYNEKGEKVGFGSTKTDKYFLYEDAGLLNPVTVIQAPHLDEDYLEEDHLEELRKQFAQAQPGALTHEVVSPSVVVNITNATQVEELLESNPDIIARLSEKCLNRLVAKMISACQGRIFDSFNSNYQKTSPFYIEVVNGQMCIKVHTHDFETGRDYRVSFNDHFSHLASNYVKNALTEELFKKVFEKLNEENKKAVDEHVNTPGFKQGLEIFAMEKLKNLFDRFFYKEKKELENEHN